MKEENSNQKRHVSKYILGLVIILGAIAIILYINQDQHSEKIQLSEIPLEKLNQGYDLVCKARDNQELCIYNNTGGTTFNGEGMLKIPVNKTNFINTPVYEIKTQNGTCLHEYHVDYVNQTTACFNGAYFPKDKWIISQVLGYGNNTLYSFINGTGSN